MPALARPTDRTARARGDRPAVAESAELCLRRNSYLALANVSCDCRDGVLTLTGCVSTYYLKQLAQEAVADVRGVVRIDNQIAVLSSGLRESK